MFDHSFHRRANFIDRVKTTIALVVAALFLLAICHFIYITADGNGIPAGVGGGFSDDHRVLNAARGVGLRNPRVVGALPLYECGRDDSWFSSARVVGENLNGDTVTVIICCGPFEGFSKGCTPRF